MDVAACTLFVTLAGSHAHGTAHAGSDVDLRGVCVAPLCTRASYRGHFEQYEGAVPDALWERIEPRLQAHPTARASLGHKIESVVFDVVKFVRLAAEANPNALEVLFAAQEDWVHVEPAWCVVHDQRHAFLSRKVEQTYLGYALAQLKRIRTHRAWLLTPPERRPARRDFGLPDEATLGHDDRDRIERAIAERARSYALEELEMPRATRIALNERLRRFWMDTLAVSDDELDGALRTTATRALGIPAELARTLAAERSYRAALKHFESYETWKEQRNPARAALEARFGYDTKHAMHLVRLMRTGLELLEAGELRVKRSDAAEFAAIRDGALSYDALIAEAERLEARMRAAAASSTLPADVNHEQIEELSCRIVRASAH